MGQEDMVSSRGSRRASRGGGGDRDDRGWTMLHIGARRGDVKEVYVFISLYMYILLMCLFLYWC